MGSAASFSMPPASAIPPLPSSMPAARSTSRLSRFISPIPIRREPYRRRSYISEAATGVICGLGATGYLLAIDALAGLLKD